MCEDDGVAPAPGGADDGVTGDEPALGRFMQVALRKGWPTEALQFTPWLSRL